MFDIFYSLHVQRIGQLMHTLSNVFFSLTLVKLSIHVFLVGTFKHLKQCRAITSLKYLI